LSNYWDLSIKIEVSKTGLVITERMISLRKGIGAKDLLFWAREGGHAVLFL